MELDSVTTLIAQRLDPDAAIFAEDFEETVLPRFLRTVIRFGIAA